ncbi:MAG TPA: hypothetical protein VHD86_22000 [Xanthobacteraceae bacterium]|jgi:hypothetical protein|nr:hypothetical protein [Xanthobacteraceae bacterium]
MSRLRTEAILLVTALALAGCDSFGGSKPKPDFVVNPNVYPANYRKQIADLLTMQLTNPVEFRTALISQPVLKPVTDGTEPHYLVCLRYPNRADHQIKVVIFLEAAPTQYIDATPQQCSDAAYQPFTELAKMSPVK